MSSLHAHQFDNSYRGCRITNPYRWKAFMIKKWLGISIESQDLTKRTQKSKEECSHNE